MTVAAEPDPLSPLDPVRVGPTTFYVDRQRPVAALLDDGCALPRFATWNEAPVGKVATSVHLLPAPSGVWVCYRDLDALVSDPAERLSRTVHLAPSGEATPLLLGTQVARGTDSLGIWSGPDQQQKLDVEYGGGDLPTGWSEPMVLTRTRLDGTREQLATDRYVYDIREIEGRLNLVFAPTPPVATRTGSSVGYSYRLALMQLEEPGHLPSAIAAATYPSREFTFEEYSATGRSNEPESTAFSLVGVADTRWPLGPLSDEDIRRAVREAERRFEDIDRFWVNSDGGRPLAQGVSQGSVHSEGAWPNTRIVIRFRHPYFAGGSIERHQRVFDDAGRISMSDYAAIHLMEDIETRKFPPLSSAVDGVLLM